MTQKQTLLVDIIDWQPSVDLRKISQRESRLAEHGFKLKNQQGVIFSNKACDRFRLILRWNGMLVLLIPPTNEDRADRCSLYLKIAQWLRKNFQLSEFLDESFDEEIVQAKQRVKRSAGA
tara:strand:- start:253 stop:612 length:360 start_codon:yes stop_codon:yes gene_type:complete